MTDKEKLLHLLTEFGVEWREKLLESFFAIGKLNKE